MPETKPPNDTCGAVLLIGDDFGDNGATMKCQCLSEHEGPHSKMFLRKGTPVTVTWHVDERPCLACNGEGMVVPTEYRTEEGWIDWTLWEQHHGQEAMPPECSECRGHGDRS